MNKLDQYKQIRVELEQIEARKTELKDLKSRIALELYQENGKDKTYVIDGANFFISPSRGGTYFLTPCKRGGGRKRTTLDDSVPAVEVIEGSLEEEAEAQPSEAEAQPAAESSEEAEAQPAAESSEDDFDAMLKKAME